MLNVNKTVQKLRRNSVKNLLKTKCMEDRIMKKLNDGFLENISGGGARETAYDVSFFVTEATVVSALGCGIASCVYFSKANKSKSAEKSSDYAKYLKKAQNCGIAATSLLGATVGSGILTYWTSPKENKEDGTGSSSFDYSDVDFQTISVL